MAGMKLADWMTKTGTTIPQLAEGTGEGVETCRLWVKGKRTPRKEAMSKLFAFTDGKVSANDFFDIPNEPAPTEVAASAADAA